MLKRQIPDVIWGCLFGGFVTVVVFGATYKYLPSPADMLGDAAAECHQSAIQNQEEATNAKNGTQENAAIFQNAKPGNHKNDPENQKQEYDCLVVSQFDCGN
jgi:hypothetical protein